jgi:hypothetical protein
VKYSSSFTCFLPLILLVPIRLGAATPVYAVEVSVWSVTGSSVSLHGGMRVDALFFRKGHDGSPLTPHELLLVLRNVEVERSSPSANKGDRNPPEVTSLLLTQGQAQDVRALPAAAVQLLVTSIPEGSGKSPHSEDISASPGSAARRGSTAAVQAYAPANWQGSADDELPVSRDLSKGVLGTLLRYFVWPTVGFLVLKTFAGTIRSARRSKSVIRKRRTTPSD